MNYLSLVLGNLHGFSNIIILLAIVIIALKCFYEVLNIISILGNVKYKYLFLTFVIGVLMNIFIPSDLQLMRIESMEKLKLKEENAQMRLVIQKQALEQQLEELQKDW